MFHNPGQPPGACRAGGVIDTGLPLSRRALAGSTVAHVVVSVLALVLPYAAIVGADGGRGLPSFIKEGGLMSIIVAGLHPFLAIAIFVLGLFVVRGKRVPLPAMFGVALVPAMLSLLGCAFYQNSVTRAVSGESVGMGLKLRILAEGYAELDSGFILGKAGS